MRVAHRRLVLAGLLAGFGLVVAPSAASGRRTGPEPSVPSDDALAAARDGLAEYLRAHADDNEPPDCPAISQDALERAVFDSGADALVLGDWGVEIEHAEYRDVGDGAIQGIVCGGDEDGDRHGREIGRSIGVVAVDLAEHATFAELEEELFPAIQWDRRDLAGGQAQSGCGDLDGDPLCLALWHRDGLVLGVVSSATDAEQTDATLDAILHPMLDSLAAASASGD